MSRGRNMHDPWRCANWSSCPDPIKTLEIYKELALEDDGLSSGSRNTPVACFQLSGSQECRELL